MERCRDIEMELAAYCGRELGPAERKLVKAHMDVCAACRAELVREMSLRQTLGSLPLAEAPGTLDSRILAVVQPTDSGYGWSRPKIRLGSAAVLVAACLAVVLLLPSLRPSSAPEPSWTQEEIAAARQDVMYTLALTAKVINRTQKDTVVEVFAERLPNAINESFKKVKLTNTGGNG
jgi:anti-sigma factor RsiW